MILLFFGLQSSAQKLDPILDRSTLSFNYGLLYDFFAKNQSGDIYDFGSRDSWGQIFGFEYSYRPEGKKTNGVLAFQSKFIVKNITKTLFFGVL